jgi:hypothetical protein
MKKAEWRTEKSPSPEGLEHPSKCGQAEADIIEEGIDTRY